MLFRLYFVMAAAYPDTIYPPGASVLCNKHERRRRICRILIHIASSYELFDHCKFPVLASSERNLFAFHFQLDFTVSVDRQFVGKGMNLNRLGGYAESCHAFPVWPIHSAAYPVIPE